MLAKIIQFVKTHQADIILVIGVILISLLSFSVGYITAKQQEKEPIRIEYNPNLQMKSEPTNQLFGAFGYNSDDIRIIL